MRETDAGVARASARPLVECWPLVSDRMRIRGLSSRTQAEYLTQASRFASWFLETSGRHARVADLTTTSGNAFIVWAEDAARADGRRWRAATRAAYARNLRSFAHHLARVLDLPANPLGGLAVARTQQREPDALDDEVQADLLGSLDGTDPYEVITRALVALSLEAGPRSSELAAMDVEDFAMARHRGRDLGMVVHVRHPAKGGSPRTLPLGAVAEDFIRAAVGNRITGPLFPGRDGGRMEVKALSKRVTRAGRRLGITIAPHRLRRTAASTYITYGAQSGQANAVFGWKPDPLDVKAGSYTTPTLPQLLYAHQERLSPLDRLELELADRGLPPLR